MPRDALIAIVGGLLSAFAAMAFQGGSAMVLVFVYLAPVPILLVGLGRGPGSALIAAATGFVATGVFGGLLLAGMYGLVYALPAWILARYAVSQQQSPDDSGTSGGWPSVGVPLAVLALLAASIILLADINAGGVGLRGSLHAYMAEVISVLAPTADGDWRGKMINNILPLFPGAVGVSWVILTVVNAIIAQGILVRIGRNLRPSPAYAELQLPQWVSWPLVLSAGAALSGPLLGMEDLGYVGRNSAMVTAVPFFFLGLAVIHTLARRVAATTAVLVVVYLVVILSGWAALVVAGVGVTELWVGLRDRTGKLDAGPRPGDDE